MAPARTAAADHRHAGGFRLAGRRAWAGPASTSPRVPAALAAAERLADGARAAGVPVIFVGLQTPANPASPFWTEWTRAAGRPRTRFAAWASLARPLSARSRRRAKQVIGKPRYSGFSGTDLDAALKAARVDTLVVCGLTTECCVDCTVRDAFHLDYHVFIAADACAAYEPDLHAAALRALALNCASLVTADEVMSAWSRPL